MPVRDGALPAALADRLDRLRSAEPYKVGFPGWSTPMPEALLPFFSHELNNYGDPDGDPVFPWHTKDLEREVIDQVAEMFGARLDSRWGMVTVGSGEAILYGLWHARQRFPHACVFHSTAAHPSVLRAAALLRMPAVAVPTDGRGELDYAALRSRCARTPGSAAVVVATVGTTLTEAVDDVPRIRAVLADAGVTDQYLHVDAALAGMPIALASGCPPSFGLHNQGGDSLSISGHKFLGTPFPTGLLLARSGPLPTAVPGSTLCGAPDGTSSSRNGHAALLLWYHLRRHGAGGLRRMALRCQAVAEYAARRLSAAGWPAWRAHRYALTVVFRTPPPAVLDRWPMPAVGEISHIVCTPGVTHERIDRFVAAVRAAS
ncbi:MULTISPECIES: pyridoxal-dependent decarboxylase [Micromonospora]|uniref:L-histidine carboxy-lyase (Histamine-forming) n=1 Tax=Micromonospora yangpuensis TaxID=683228 RepID=A0A1C6TX49_9ACTN|nr:pyridoxal-dependent decarboxylase [Micromonospora yangpuensis]SCL46390.1 L-histidine carboxy-lyase (histamine-forming) [Micromonospora yangpuensis]